MSDGFGDFLKEQQDNGTLTAPPATPAPQQTTQALQAPQEDDSFGAFLKQTKSTAITQNAIAVNSQNSATNPETAAKAAVLSRQLNMPQAAVELDVPHYENQAKLQKNNEILSKSPVLARWVGDNPDPARIAQNELDKLSTIEKIWKSTKDVPYELLKGAGEDANKSKNSVNNVLAYIGNKLNDIGVNPNRYDYWNDANDTNAAALKVDPNAGFIAKASHMVGGLADTLSHIFLTGNPAAATESATTSVTQSVTEAVKHGARSMAFPSAVDAVNTASNVYEKTGDANQAIKAAQMQYATTTAGGIVPLGVPGRLATRLGTGFVSGVATGEASRQAMNLVLPDSMKQDFNPEDAVLSGLSASLLAGVMGPRAQRGMQDTIRKTYQDAAKSEQAVKAGESIQQLSEIATNSKLRESDPAAFKDFIKRASEDTPLDSVYVDKAKLTEAFNQSGVTAEEIQRKMPEVAKQLNDAASSDIRIPVEDYATHIAGSDMDKVLLQELKSDPDGMTIKEGQEHYAKAVDQLQEQAKHITDLHNQDVADAADLQAVHQNILDQLTATGRYKPDVAKVNATIVSEFYAAQAARTGMKPSEFAAQHPLHINAENPVGEKLDQSSLRDQHIWQAVGQNEKGPVYKGNGFTLDPVRAVPHETDFDAGGMTHIGLMGHVAHVVEGAKPYIFAINKNGLKVGHLVADVKDGQIVGIHDITSYNKKAGLGASVAAHIAANIKEAVKVHEVLDQSRSFWEKIGAHEQDQYKNSSFDWQSIARYLDGKQGSDQARSDGAQDITRSNDAHGLEAKELTEAEIKELEAQGFKFNQPAYHGSPHDFTKFSLDKIGTGEGAQAYGHGLYFAESKDVAETYRPQITYKASYRLRGRDLVDLYNEFTDKGMYGHAALAERILTHTSRDEVIKYAENADNGIDQDAIKWVKSLPKSLFAKTGGKLYQVDIPDEHVANFLQWDKPLSEQPQSVQDALAKNDYLKQVAEYSGKHDPDHVLLGQDAYQALTRSLGSPEAASKYLDSLGIKGIKFLDQGSRGEGDGTHNLVVFDDSIIKLTHKDGTPVSNSERNEYFQSLNQPRDGEENRGAFSPSTNTISLLKSADLSTFAHEAGHFFLETMGKLASAESAHPQIKTDFDAALKWMGVKDADTWNSMSLEQKREFHEKFARGWEQYLMEGKSPNLKMQQIFSRFRAWMISVYRNLRNLNVDITPEVRQVFDRMIATDASIHEAEQARSFMPLFKDSKEAGVSDKDFEKYQQLGQDATDTAIAQMQAKSMKDMQWASNAKAQALKDLQKQHDVARKEVQAQVTKEVMSEPVNKARNWIKNGEMTNDKGELVALSKDAKKAAKLNTDAVKSMFPESALDHPDMSKLKGLTGPDGLHPDLLADMFGFRNGEELVRSLIENGDPKDRINAMTDQRMLESHGELVNPDSIEQAANEAVHNEARAKFMASGLKILTKSPLPAREIAKAAKEVADRMIAEKRVRDLNERQYLSAETKANKEAVSLAAKDPQGAVEAQRTALLNNRLAKSAADAITAVQKGVDYLKKFDKESIRNKIDLEYRDQIDALLDRYDLRQSVSNKALDKRESLSNFVERQAALGLQTDIPQKLLDEANRMHYKDMPVEDFKGLVDSVKMIENLGRLKDKLLEAKHQRDLQTAADEAVKVMSGLKQHDFDNNRGLSRLETKFADAKAFGRSLTTSLLKMEQVMDWLDRRDPNGPMNTYVFRPIADAGIKANDMMVKMKAGIDELVHKNLEDITKDKGKIYTSDKLIDSKTGKPLELTKKEMLDMAGHLGNESSWDKLLRGEKWDDQVAREFLMANMRKGDWDYVAGIGKALESLWPAKLEMNRRLGISDAEKIQPRAFDTEHGTYEGWYWPMKYDPARSVHVEDRTNKSAEAIFESQFTRQSMDTDTGRMNTRNENYAAPILLGIDALPRIIADEIHDTAYREAVINANEFVTHPDVRKAIISAMSKQHYDQIRPWLVSIANDGRLDQSNMRAMKWMDSMAHQARIRATMVGLGFRLSTMIVHGLSAGMESVAELGPKWFGSGLKDFTNPTQWAENQKFIFERSGEMRNRMNEVDRDVREHLREIDLRMADPATTAVQRGADFMKANAYKGIAMLDMMTALPTWKGAYNKALEAPEKGGLGMSEQDAIYYADKTIRNAHGGTGIKDLAAIQRGPEMMKLFTMFYTFWNHNINRIADTAKMATELPETYRSGDMQKFKGDASSVIMRTLIYTFGVQAMHGLLHPPKEEDGEEGWAKWAGKALVGAFTGGIPVARDVAPYLLGEKDYGVTPAASLVKAVHDSSIDAMHASLGEDVSDKWLKHTINTAGYVFGLPTGQPAATAQFLYDFEQGNTNPQDAGDWWRGILTGDTKHH